MSRSSDAPATFNDQLFADCFAVVDSDGSGRISRPQAAELSWMLGQDVTAAEVERHFDGRCPGGISQSDYREAFFRIRRPAIRANRLQQDFDITDITSPDRYREVVTSGPHALTAKEAEYITKVFREERVSIDNLPAFLASTGRLLPYLS